jgi:hypothetical protein
MQIYLFIFNLRLQINEMVNYRRPGRSTWGRHPVPLEVLGDHERQAHQDDQMVRVGQQCLIF